MNPLDYGSLEACQRLVKAGIVLETERYHETHGIDCYELVTKEKRDAYLDDVNKKHVSLFNFKWVPAPSMAEVWRELPEDEDKLIRLIFDYFRFIGKDLTLLSFIQLVKKIDRMIDLLIWVTEQRKEEGNA
jgi:hypothetical protein